MNRSFLFLQGVCSPFFSKLGERLRSGGHDILKVNFTVGDSMYWMGPSLRYRDGNDGLDDFYREQYRANGTTDIVLFGDCRPIHEPAIAIARASGIRVHVYEEGYFRPFWVTLERGGVNGYSSLPNDPIWYRKVGARLPRVGNGTAFASPFWVRAGHDVLYNLGGPLNRFFFPAFPSHVPHNVALEYLAYIRRSAKRLMGDRLDMLKINAILKGKRPFFLLPLQLNTDSQVRVHSPFNDMQEALRHTIASYANYAPKNSLLLVKNHPLDPGFVNYASQIKRLCHEFDLIGRLTFIECGHLPTLLNHAAGVVTVNSTVGSSALIHGCPLIALGKAIYDMPGLTFQKGLDRFWTEGAKPNRRLFHYFRNTVVYVSQINGGFYCTQGIQMAVDGSLAALTGQESKLDELLARAPL